MDDYEIENARTWDNSLKNVPPPSNHGGTKFEWQEVGGSKKQNKKNKPTSIQKAKNAKAPTQAQSLRRVSAGPSTRNPFQALENQQDRSLDNAAPSIASSSLTTHSIATIRPTPPQAALSERNVSSGITYNAKAPVPAPAPPPPPQSKRVDAAPRPTPSHVQAVPHQRGGQQPRNGRPAPTAGVPPEHWYPARSRVPTKRVRARNVPRMITDPDNDGQDAWRHRKPPLELIKIPEGPGLEHRQELETIAADMGCFLYCEHQSADSSGNFKFGIWGPEPNVQAVKKELIYRLGDDQERRHGRSAMYAKICSLTPGLRIRAEKRWAREVRRNRYRQYPPKNMAFEVIGTFHWPSTEYSPEDVLGKSYEAFDPIRMDCECYVVYIPEVSCFQVMGRKQQVQNALSRIRNTCFQLASRSVNPVRSYLLHWRGRNVSTHVYLEEYRGPQIISGPSDIISYSGYSPRGNGSLDDEDELSIAELNSSISVARVRATLANALRKMHFYQGHLELRIRLGVFLLTQYMKPEDGFYGLQEYDEMTKASQFSGRVTEELGQPTNVAKVLRAFMQSTELLAPEDALLNDLATVKPSYAVTFIFDDALGDVRLTMSWSEAVQFEIGKSPFALDAVSWARLDRDTGTAQKLIDMSLLELTTGTAWAFELTACRALDEARIPKELRNFPAKVQLDPAVAFDWTTDKCFVLYNPFRQPKFIRQETRYRYNLLDTDCTFELSRYQDRSYPVRQSLLAQPVPTVIEPCWSLNVFRPDWDTTLARNQKLAIGDKVDWEDDLQNWFPEEFGSGAVAGADGFEQLVNKLTQIESIVRDSQE